MNSLRKWLLKPKRTDQSLLAKFYYADEELNAVASELDSFDGRKDTTRCNNLVLKLRNHQDSVLSIVEQIMKEVIPISRARRDYRIKFPEEVLQENLAGQLWFGAECLAAGSSIVNKEIESLTMRPLARTFTKQLDELRSLLREQCFRNLYSYNEEITKALVNFDKLFADFELSYVSAMVPVKSMKEYDLLQDITVLFCETVSRSMKLGLLNQDQFDSYDPSLMFTIPRLAIICGLLVFPDGPLNPDQDPCQVSEMFRQQQTLLFKIRELLVTLQPDELRSLEELICDPTEGTTTAVTHVSKSVDNVQSPPEEEESEPIDAEEFQFGEEEEEENGAVVPGIKVSIEVPQKKKKLKSFSWPEDGNENHRSPVAPLLSEQPVDEDAKLQLRNSNHRHISRGSSSPFPPRPQAPYTVRSISWRGSNEFNFLLPRNTSVDQQLLDSNNVPYNANISAVTDITHPDTCSADGMMRYRDSFHNRQVLRFLQAGRTPAQLTSHEVANSEEPPCQYNGGARPKQYRSRRWTGTDRGDSKPGNLHRHERQFSASGAETVPTLNQNFRDEEIERDPEEGFGVVSASPSGVIESNRDATTGCGDLLQATSRIDRTLADPIVSMCAKFSNCPVGDGRDSSDRRISIDPASGSEKIFAEQNFNNTNSNNNNVIINAGDVPMCNGGVERSHNLDDVFFNLNRSSIEQRGYRGDFQAVRLNGYRSQPPLGYRESESTGSSSSCTSPMNFVAEHEEISRIIQIAEQAAGLEARSKFKSSSDLVHQLFVCISKVADQLQTNFASDFRHILKATFECYSTVADDDDDGVVMVEGGANDRETSSVLRQSSAAGSVATSRNNRVPGIPFSDDPGFEIDQAVIDALEHLADIHMIACREESLEPPAWVPDECCSHCMSCKVPFSFVRRRHHCRNCGKIFCNQCSSNSVALPHIGHVKPVRVCNSCYLFHLIPFTNTSQ